MDLHAIDRRIDPAVVRIAHDDQAAGTDVRAAILLVPYRRREFRHIDGVALDGIFAPGGAIHFNGLMGRQRLAFCHPGLEGIEGAQAGIDTERQRGALRIRHRIGEHAKPGRIAFDPVEQQRRAIGHAGCDLGNAADLMARIGALDAPQRLESLDLGDEFTKILVRHVCLALPLYRS